MTKITNLTQLIKHEVLDLRSAEEQIIEALPKMIDKCESAELQEALRTHLQQTEQHVNRLETVMEKLSITEESEKCKGIEGIIKEGEHLLSLVSFGATGDAAIIAAAQKVEHYEMAAYMSLIRHLTISEEIELSLILKDTLEEEGEADELLSEIAETSIDENSLDDSGRH